MASDPDPREQEAQPAAGQADALFTLAYQELRAVARSYANGQTLQATALVHEAYQRIASAEPRWNDREHFLAVAARAMRQVFIDDLRKKAAANRPDPKRRITLVDELHREGGSELDFLELHVALERLETIKPRYVRLVELRFFGGMTEEEAARVLGISPRTAKREWRAARAWLASELREPTDAAPEQPES